MARRKMTVLQERFAAYYDGNATEASRKAGCHGKNISAVASKMMKNPLVRAAIAAREKETMKKGIATREERQQFWTEVMLDETREMKDRLKASELLGRSQADFTENVNNDTQLTIQIMNRFPLKNEREVAPELRSIETTGYDDAPLHE